MIPLFPSVKVMILNQLCDLCFLRPWVQWPLPRTLHSGMSKLLLQLSLSCTHPQRMNMSIAPGSGQLTPVPFSTEMSHLMIGITYYITTPKTHELLMIPLPFPRLFNVLPLSKLMTVNSQRFSVTSHISLTLLTISCTRSSQLVMCLKKVKSSSSPFPTTCESSWNYW